MKFEPPITKKSSKAAMFREVASLRREVADQQSTINILRKEASELLAQIKAFKLQAQGFDRQVAEVKNSFSVEINQLAVIRKVLELQRGPDWDAKTAV